MEPRQLPPEFRRQRPRPTAEVHRTLATKHHSTRGFILRVPGREAHLERQAAAAGVAGADGGELFCGRRSSVARGIAFQCVEERGKGLEGCYASRGVGWTLQGDHLVTGASSTASSGGGASRSSRGQRLQQSNEEGKRGKRWRSSQRVQRWPRRGRGRSGADEFDGDGRRVRGRRRAR